MHTSIRTLTRAGTSTCICTRPYAHSLVLVHVQTLMYTVSHQDELLTELDGAVAEEEEEEEEECVEAHVLCELAAIRQTMQARSVCGAID